MDTIKRFVEFEDMHGIKSMLEVTQTSWPSGWRYTMLYFKRNGMSFDLFVDWKAEVEDTKLHAVLKDDDIPEYEVRAAWSIDPKCILDKYEDYDKFIEAAIIPAITQGMSQFSLWMNTNPVSMERCFKAFKSFSQHYNTLVGEDNSFGTPERRATKFDRYDHA